MVINSSFDIFQEIIFHADSDKFYYKGMPFIDHELKTALINRVNNIFNSLNFFFTMCYVGKLQVLFQVFKSQSLDEPNSLVNRRKTFKNRGVSYFNFKFSKSRELNLVHLFRSLTIKLWYVASTRFVSRLFPFTFP